MTKTIWKYKLEITDYQEVQMPKNANILCVQTQYNEPCVWAVVEPDNELETIKFKIIGTGHQYPVDEHLRYVGTFQVNEGAFIGHLFEVME